MPLFHGTVKVASSRPLFSDRMSLQAGAAEGHRKQTVRGGVLPFDHHRNVALGSALRNGTHEERLGEFADVIAWLTTMANVVGVDLTEAVARKYGSGCPGCNQFICTCADAEKP
jgi:hypothetical protein